ncbi:hypothetical protein ACFYXL_33000 [Streptomyces tsukubensis]|uniref:hypothetical protein n=1 Tax=Streptomyces tsukubensis TaxID=83656 RepID=UPI0036A67D05
MTSTSPITIRPESARWPLPDGTTAVPDPVLFALAMRDMRLTWRARGVLASGYPAGQEPRMGELTSLTRDERGPAPEGRGAFSKAVAELRALGYLTPDGTTATGVGERLVVDLTPATAAHLVRPYDEDWS